MMAVGVSSGRPWKQGAGVTPARPMVGVPPSRDPPDAGCLCCSCVLPSVPPWRAASLPGRGGGLLTSLATPATLARPVAPPTSTGASLGTLLHASALGERSHSKAHVRPAAIH